MTIEERAKIAFPRLEDPADVLSRHGYIAGATEQDTIARADERERCIKIAQDVFCWMKCNKTNDRGVCYAKDGLPEHCFWHNQIRKAMEEEDSK